MSGFTASDSCLTLVPKVSEALWDRGCSLETLFPNSRGRCFIFRSKAPRQWETEQRCSWSSIILQKSEVGGSGKEASPAGVLGEHGGVHWRFDGLGGLPFEVWVFEDGIEEEQEFAHDGGDGEFGWFTGLAQALVDGFENVVLRSAARAAMYSPGGLAADPTTAMSLVTWASKSASAFCTAAIKPSTP
jgi:hypothetical protein